MVTTLMIQSLDLFRLKLGEPVTPFLAFSTIFLLKMNIHFVVSYRPSA
jgi:hypothetical protein